MLTSTRLKSFQCLFILVFYYIVSIFICSIESENSIGKRIQFLTEPNQPRNFKFPARTFGKQNFKRSFQPAWFDKFKWLHYDPDTDSAFCFMCIKALHHNMISSTKGEIVFTEKGFRNWKTALSKGRGFYKHKTSACHKEGLVRWKEVPSTVNGDIGEMISTQHALEKFKNRRILLKILGNVRYLGKRLR